MGDKLTDGVPLWFHLSVTTGLWACGILAHWQGRRIGRRRATPVAELEAEVLDRSFMAGWNARGHVERRTGP